MELTTEPLGNHAIHHYEPGQVMIAGKTYQQSFIVTPDTIIHPWLVNDIHHLSAEHCQVLIDLQPTIVIIGTGEQQYFLPPVLMAQFITQKIGVETMNTAAACRTFNILLSEGRSVAAGMILSPSS